MVLGYEEPSCGNFLSETAMLTEAIAGGFSPASPMSRLMGSSCDALSARHEQSASLWHMLWHMSNRTLRARHIKVFRNGRNRAQRIGKVGEANVCSSIVVAAELRYGPKKRAHPDFQLNWKPYWERLKF